jgi:hypothetical protein
MLFSTRRIFYFTLILLVSGFFVLSMVVRAAYAVESDIAGTYGTMDSAGTPIITKDPGAISQQKQGNWLTQAIDTVTKGLAKAGSQAFGSAVRTALNTFAYDTANKIANGINGQQSAFETRSFGEIFQDSLDSAAGDFLYTLGNEGFNGLNLCEPSLGINLSIGLGLVQYQKPQVQCTFSELRDNWEQELRNPTFLRDFQNYFEPTQNDLGIALSAQTMFLEQQGQNATNIINETIAKQGWLDVRNLAGKTETPSSLVQEAAKEDLVRKDPSWAQYTGDALIDAVNIFLNQLAIQLLRNLLWGGLGSSGSSGVNLYNFQADAGASDGIAAAKDRFRQIIQPRFDVRGDYDVLAELVQCPDPNAAGTTNCVITDKFRQAIQDRKTVGQAMKDGSLNSAGTFGFEAKDKEPRLADENYPYRSMLILRKFRILPVGWEVAANYINEHFGEEKIKQTTLEELVNCFSGTDDYGSKETDNNGVETTRWCRGLVDPNWVLKAPLNYCAREGYGPETFGEPQVVNGQYLIARKDTYCADEQACIKENADGSCDVYGYCTEERRTWNFGGDSCNPLYNTCQTFTDTKGASVSYLQNTLEWCNSNGNGCQSYATNFDYASQTWKDDLTEETDNIYLNSNAQTCDAADEGCHEFIRVKPGLGTNLIPNASFEQGSGGNIDHWGQDETGASKVEGAFDGTYALSVNSAIGYSTDNNFDLQKDSRYIFSGYVKNIDASHVYADVNDTYKTNDLEAIKDWQRFSIIITPQNEIKNYVIHLQADDGTAVFDALQLEEVATGDSPNAFKNYRGANVIYEKKMPADALNFCYNVDTTNNSVTKKTGLSAEEENTCANLDKTFARQCSVADVGCEIFTRVADNFGVPAQVKPDDYCPAECNGYDTYIQGQTYFQTTPIATYFIPQSAQTCSAQNAGCEQFTNLDEVAQGGEGIEYYSKLRQCTPDSTISKPFYTWEGSGETGFQLKVFSLKDANTDNVPDVTFGKMVLDDNKNYQQEDLNGSVVCSADIFNADITSGEYNADCRQFYSRSGQISYVLDSDTIHYATDCHPYRLSTDYGAPDCEASGGTYNSNNECIYMAIPNEGVMCPAQASGCHAYTGNVGNNLRVVFADDFEDGQTADWTSGAVSNESLKQGGKSLQVDEGIAETSKPIGSLLASGQVVNKSFEIELTMKGTKNNSFDVLMLGSGAKDIKNFGTVTLDKDNEWQTFKLNIELASSAIATTELLSIQHRGGTNVNKFYIDSIVLRERTSTYYLIKDSWQTPQSCWDDTGSATKFFDNKINDTTKEITPGKYVGCYEYKNADSQSSYLYDFTKLCAESAAGCELMIDTQNYTPYSGDPGNNTTLTDEFTYMVYAPDKQCGTDAKSCQALGSPRTGGFDTTYRKNDPDRYGTILCTQNQVSCEEYKGTDGKVAYFKNPGDNVCEYRDGYFGYTWYEKKVKYCDADGQGVHDASGELVDTQQCSTNSDCAQNIKCVLDDWDYKCSVDDAGAPKTIGIGGAGNRVIQPAKNDDTNWVGLCPAYQSSCTEIIDPVSKAGTNELFNADFGQVISGGPDGWSSGGGNLVDQKVTLTQNTLYRLGAVLKSEHVAGNYETSLFDCTNSAGENAAIYPLNTQTNTLVSFDNWADNVRHCPIHQAWTDNDCGMDTTQGLLFYSGDAATCSVRVRDYNNLASVELKKADVNYQLASGLDRSCTGQPDSDNGCVLFNVRSVAGANPGHTASYKPLAFNANAAQTGQTAAACSGDGCNSNEILKVAADRVCDEWLACKSSAVILNDQGQEERICYDIGTCNGLNEANQCKSWVITQLENRTITIDDRTDKQHILNVSGYAKVGFESGNTQTQGDFPLGAMSQAGDLAVVPNGGFEFSSGTNVPLNWTLRDANNTIVQDASNLVSTVNSPQAAQKYDIRYPIEGRQFLALGAAYSLESQVPIEIAPNTDYALTAYVNTLSLNSGEAQVRVESGSKVVATITQAAGKNWEKKFIKFNSGTANRATIVIEAVSDPRGTFFVDNVQIRPALEIKTTTTGTFYQPQDCRLYPKADALSCSYLDDTGVNQKGWYGYCLEYDRAPVGNPDACLLWWPIDRAKGDGVNEQVPSYAGKVPLYQCVEAEDNHYVAIPDAFKQIRMQAQYGCTSSKDNGYFNTFKYKLLVDGVVRSFDGIDLPEVLGKFKPGSFPQIPGYGKVGGTPSNVELNLEVAPSFTVDGIDYYDFTKTAWITYIQTDCKATENVTIKRNSYVLDNNTVPICKRLVQTVDILGQNKAWTSRVQEGSSYAMACYDAVSETLSNTNECRYASDAAPFGSIAAPAPAGDPSQWSSKNSIIKIPLIAEPPDKSLGSPYQARFRYVMPYQSGAVQSVPVQTDLTNMSTLTGGGVVGVSKNGSSVMGAFAQSYGSWTWQEGAASGTCQNDPGKFCDNKYDKVCTGSGDCNFVGNQCITTETKKCIGGIKNGSTCTDNSECKFDVAQSCVNSMCTPKLTEGITCDGSNINDVLDKCWHFAGGNYDGTCEVVDTASTCTLTPDVPCSINSDCVQTHGACSVGVCSNNNTQQCFSDAQCATNGSYVKDATMIAWDVPTTTCPAGTHSSDQSRYCAVLPIVKDISVNGKLNGDAVLTPQDAQVHLTFNSDVDDDQLPLVELRVDWGDGDTTSITGMEMRERTNTENPHSFYHIYNYWDLLQKSKSVSGISCANDATYGNYCAVVPKVWLRDNWGWYSKGTEKDKPPGNPDKFGGLMQGRVVVKER